MTGVTTGGMAQSIYLYVPAYTFNPEFEQAYLSTPIKQIKYTDVYQYQINGVGTGQTMNSLVTNGIANIKSILLLPFYSSSGPAAAVTQLRSAVTTSYMVRMQSMVVLLTVSLPLLLVVKNLTWNIATTTSTLNACFQLKWQYLNLFKSLVKTCPLKLSITWYSLSTALNSQLMPSPVPVSKSYNKTKNKINNIGCKTIINN